MSEFRIIGDGVKIGVTVLGYERATALNTSDANWLNCDIDLAVPPFSGNYRAAISTQDFARFGEQLRGLSQHLVGSAEFSTDEQALRVTLTVGSRGELSIEGEASVTGNVRAALRFQAAADQSYLNDLVRAVSDVTQSFPIRRVDAR
jgi:hypothetical protein